MSRTIQIYGRRLANRRNDLFMTADELSQKTMELDREKGMKAGNIRRIEGEDVAGIYKKSVPVLAQALKMTEAEFLAKIAVPSGVADGRKGHSAVGVGGPVMPPVFDLPIAASGWEELEAPGLTANPEQIAAGWFVVRVRGDSMEPVWKDGELVMFQRINLDDGPPSVGDDFLIVRSDGAGTFKRVIKLEDETIFLKAVNPKYRKPMEVALQEVAQIAWARFALTDRRPG